MGKRRPQGPGDPAVPAQDSARRTTVLQPSPGEAASLVQSSPGPDSIPLARLARARPTCSNCRSDRATTASGRRQTHGRISWEPSSSAAMAHTSAPDGLVVVQYSHQSNADHLHPLPDRNLSSRALSSVAGVGCARRDAVSLAGRVLKDASPPVSDEPVHADRAAQRPVRLERSQALLHVPAPEERQSAQAPAASVGHVVHEWRGNGACRVVRVSFTHVVRSAVGIQLKRTSAERTRPIGVVIVVDKVE